MALLAERVCHVALNPLVSLPQTEERVHKERQEAMVKNLATGLAVAAGCCSLALLAFSLYTKLYADDKSSPASADDDQE